MGYNKCMRGQVALIVLLISAVMVTFGLSVSKRTVTENRVNSDEELLKQAFNAAESGIDNYLKTGSTSYSTIDGSSTAQVTVENIGGGSTLNYGEYSLINTPVYYWLKDHNADGTLNIGSVNFNGNDIRVCVDNDYTGVIKVDYYYKNGTNYLVWRNGYNFGSVVNGYVDATAIADNTCTGRTGAKEVVLGAPIAGGNTPLLLSVKPLFMGTQISVRTATVTATFPYQGVALSSFGKVGQVGAGALGQSGSGSTQKVRVETTYDVPGFMLEALNAEGSILSN